MPRPLLAAVRCSALLLPTRRVVNTVVCCMYVLCRFLTMFVKPFDLRPIFMYRYLVLDITVERYARSTFCCRCCAASSRNAFGLMATLWTFLFFKSVHYMHGSYYCRLLVCACVLFVSFCIAGFSGMQPRVKSESVSGVQIRY